MSPSRTCVTRDGLFLEAMYMLGCLFFSLCSSLFFNSNLPFPLSSPSCVFVCVCACVCCFFFHEYPKYKIEFIYRCVLFIFVVWRGKRGIRREKEEMNQNAGRGQHTPFPRSTTLFRSHYLDSCFFFCSRAVDRGKGVAARAGGRDLDLVARRGSSGPAPARRSLHGLQRPAAGVGVDRQALVGGGDVAAGVPGGRVLHGAVGLVVLGRRAALLVVRHAAVVRRRGLARRAVVAVLSLHLRKVAAVVVHGAERRAVVVPATLSHNILLARLADHARVRVQLPLHLLVVHRVDLLALLPLVRRLLRLRESALPALRLGHGKVQQRLLDRGGVGTHGENASDNGHCVCGFLFVLVFFRVKERCRVRGLFCLGVFGGLGCFFVLVCFRVCMWDNGGSVNEVQIL
eukprot:Rhum_TRINITY_DN9114_c1_g1::Rhum_TRINITY_DN9114_c1_g1_i1::g.31821::m.31821